MYIVFAFSILCVQLRIVVDLMHNGDLRYFLATLKDTYVRDSMMFALSILMIIIILSNKLYTMHIHACKEFHRKRLV